MTEVFAELPVCHRSSSFASRMSKSLSVPVVSDTIYREITQKTAEVCNII